MTDRDDIGSRLQVDWRAAQYPYQTSSDWERPNDAYVRKAPGWVRAMALVGLPILIWVMLLLTPAILLCILIALGSALYWSSRREEKRGASLHSQQKSEGCLSANAQTAESNRAEQAPRRGKTNGDQWPSWAALIFWVSAGGLAVRHLLNGAGA